MLGDWQTLAHRADDLVDLHFGERVIFHPQTQVDEYSALGPDPARPATDPIVVIFERPEASTSNTQGGPRAQSDFWLSIQDRLMPDYELRNEDRVEFLDGERAGTFMQISFVDPGATGRTLVHLLAS